MWTADIKYVYRDASVAVLFRSFMTQEERRRFGGSAFLEFQYCTLKRGTKLKKIVSAKAIDNFKDNSLYVSVDEIDDFFSEYKHIFRNGIYANAESGPIDICGINYYPPETMEEIIRAIEIEKPYNHLILSEWLKTGRDGNGFYILGI